MLDIIDLCTPASVIEHYASFWIEILYFCRRLLCLDSLFILWMSWPSDQHFPGSHLSSFRLCRVNNSVCVDRCLDQLSWSVDCFSGFRLCHVNNSVYVDRCLDKLSYFVECLSGFRLRHVNNSVYVDCCVDNLSWSCWYWKVLGLAGVCLLATLIGGLKHLSSYFALGQNAQAYY